MLHKKKQSEVKNQELLEKLHCLQGQSMEWLQSFMQSFGQDLVYPKIKLSNLKETRTYGRYALDNIKLSRERLEQKLYKNIIGLEQYQHHSLQLDKKLLEVRFKEPILACFSQDNIITFNIDNISEAAYKCGLDLNQYYSEIMTHEMFHSFHCQKLCSGNNWLVPVSVLKRADTVKETLAVYAEYEWIMERKLEKQARVLEERINTSYKCYPSYPYAGARILLHRPEQEGQELFYKLYRLSLASWEEAYKFLIKIG